MANSAPPIAVFDLDGTLADTIHDLVATLNVVLDRKGSAALPVEEGARHGRRRRPRADRAGLRSGGREVTPAHLDEPAPALPGPLQREYLRPDHPLPGRRARARPARGGGFPPRRLHQQVRDPFGPVLAELGIGHRFAAIAGRDSFPYFKPDPRHLTHDHRHAPEATRTGP